LGLIFGGDQEACLVPSPNRESPMITRIDRRSVPALCLVATAALSGPATAEESGRYTLAPLEGGIVKLDTSTGALTECRRKGDALSCTLVPDERQPLQDEIDRLSRENAQLRTELGSKSPAPSGTVAPSLPSDAEIDRALSLMQRLMRGLKDIMREEDDAKRI
jgi:hypothetical protein